MILVTGATGHIGNVLVRELIGMGESVRALLLPGEDQEPVRGLNLEIAEGDVLNPESLKKAFEEVDKVYHLAGIISIMPGANQLMWRVNVDGTKNVIKACLDAGVKRLVYTSSIHALKRAPHGTVIDERLPFDPDNPAGPYDRTKATASLEVLSAVKEKGLDAVIVCPTGIIGPYDWRKSEMGSLISSWMSKGMHFLIEGSFDFVDVRDVVTGHILACEKGRTGETYLIAGQQISLVTINELVQKTAGIRMPVVRIPINLAKMVANFTPLYYRLARAKPQFTSYSIQTVLENSIISVEKARRELGYVPRSMAITIRDTVLWWKENFSILVRAAKTNQG